MRMAFEASCLIVHVEAYHGNIAFSLTCVLSSAVHCE